MGTSQILPVTCHTDYVGPGSTFVAIDGFEVDGRTFIPQAVAAGAAEIILEGEPVGETKMHDGVRYTYVPNARRALAERAAHAHGYPAKKLTMIGVTGTKGKTTTVHLTHHLLKEAGINAALLSTITNARTTLPADLLHAFFADCSFSNITHVVMEVSAHALTLDRVHGIEYDAVAFTNFAHEHLEFYNSLEEYFMAKCQIFSQVKRKGAIVSGDEKAYKQAQIIRPDCTIIHPKNFTPLATHLWGEYNKQNTQISCALAESLGCAYESIQVGLKTFPGVPGRLQEHRLLSGARAFVDYAHNPSSFEAVLSTLRVMTNDLIVLFGCGGERDKAKRPAMGEIAARYGDTVIITSDNPRSEPVQHIINNIVGGVPASGQSKLIIEPDRARAIARAAHIASPESVIALLGKGHETTFVENGQVTAFDDFAQIQQY